MMLKLSKKALLPLFIVSLSISSSATEKTWTGKISDSQCGATHKNAMMQQHEQEKSIPSGHKVSARDCTLACVKNGATYVFVTQGKVYDIENQDMAGLQEHAGHTVKLTGEMNASGKGIKVSNITMPMVKSDGGKGETKPE